MTTTKRAGPYEWVHACVAPGCEAAIALVTPARSHALPDGWTGAAARGTAVLCPEHAHLRNDDDEGAEGDC